MAGSSNQIYLKLIAIQLAQEDDEISLQGGVGYVKNVTFSNILVSNVEIPIVIDQSPATRGCARTRQMQWQSPTSHREESLELIHINQCI